MFCEDLALWSFHQSGVLRYRNVLHYRADGTAAETVAASSVSSDWDTSKTLYPEPEISRNSLMYRINDEIIFEMIVEEHDLFLENSIENNSCSTDSRFWKSFIVDDLQLELVMLDPYIRTPLLPCFDSSCIRGQYKAQFKAPDVYGTFKFRVLYRRRGFTTLHIESQIILRPFKQNEYDRFIPNAYVYYASAIAAVIAFLVVLATV